MKDSTSTQTPAPDDLEGWKEISNCVTIRCAEPGWFRERLFASRAVRRYFGHDDLEGALERHDKQGALPSYGAWGILDYRPTAMSHTRAEIILAQGLSEAEATLLRARMAAHPSIYRVVRCDLRGGSVDLEDVLQGGSVCVQDKSLSKSVQPNVFLIMRVYPAGNFWLDEMIGPPLGPGQGADAIDFLRELGMEFTPDGQRRDSHLFGRLWEWLDEWAANWRPPRVCNMDGDDMLWHTGSFSVADQEQARRALVQRDDIESDENGMFRWVTTTGPSAKKMGGPVSLAQLEFVGDELILTVNSARRFAKARKWLEAIPGIAMLAVTTRQFNEPEADRPLDERMSKPEPLEMTPELGTAMQHLFEKQYMRWLDIALPVLNGKTPRDACRTPAGRHQVTMLIRTIPDPIGPVPVHVPREAMLRELEIHQQQNSALPAAEAGHRPASSAGWNGNVSRNEPCPCGSGRKFKNCCGK